MFLRRHRKTVAAETYEYWTLCESVRTPAGPRQRVVATLGKLTSDQPQAEAGWEDLARLLGGQVPPRQLPLEAPASAPPTPGPRWELADVQGLRVERVRDFGQPFLGLALWHRLGLHTLLSELIEPGEEEVPWPVMASLLTVARFCAVRSELGLAERWYAYSAMEDLLGVPGEKINDDRLYRALDVLLKHKERLCGHLMERYRSWFGVQFEFLIYDVTSTFFEGDAAANPEAQRGYSRDSRPDCKQVCIGLVCTPEGLPLAYEIFAGNRTDVTTVQEIVRLMEEKYGQARRIWVLDRGMVSEENIAFLRARGALYIVGTPKGQLRQFEAALLAKEGWTEVQSGLEAKLVAHPDGQGQEQFILCRSGARGEKEKAMLARQSDALCEQFAKIDRALQAKPQKDLEAVGRRIGRWQGRYPAAARHIQVVVAHDAQGRACGLSLSCPLERGRWTELAQGAYLLRTNSPERDPAQLWRWYIQLTQAEAAFRITKSDLSLRPIYHQNAERVRAHILVCFLALALWRTLEMWMQGKGLGSCARRLVEEIATLKSMDVVLPVRRGEQTAQLRVRTVARPERRVAELLVRLGLDLPTRNRILEDLPAGTAAENVVQKIGS